VGTGPPFDLRRRMMQANAHEIFIEASGRYRQATEPTPDIHLGSIHVAPVVS